MGLTTARSGCALPSLRRYLGGHFPSALGAGRRVAWQASKSLQPLGKGLLELRRSVAGGSFGNGSFWKRRGKIIWTVHTYLRSPVHWVMDFITGSAGRSVRMEIAVHAAPSSDSASDLDKRGRAPITFGWSRVTPCRIIKIRCGSESVHTTRVTDLQPFRFQISASLMRAVR